MSKMPPGVDSAELNVVARRVLLDALTGLTAHMNGLTVIGAQAVYLRTEEAVFDYSVAAFTSDADIALDPRAIKDDPRIGLTMSELGFRRFDNPGLWFKPVVIGGVPADVEVDLLVPELFAGKGRRSADLKPHEKNSAMRVQGIEAALFDRSPMVVGSLEPAADRRQVRVAVAGIAALLIAKAYKIDDRSVDAVDRPDRLTAKDASDVMRLFTAMDVAEVGAKFRELATVSNIGQFVNRGKELLVANFGSVESLGVVLAEQALLGTNTSDEEFAQLSLADLSTASIEALRDCW